MTTLHIIRSALEFFGILLAAYGIYRADDIVALFSKIEPDKPVVFTGSEIFWIEEAQDEAD